LTIERGILSFAGPINNPGLDILAVRKKLAVEAGVAISGTALAPRARLVSTPPVPDTEKLAWLTLGHGLEGANRAELDIVSAAAIAFASRGGGPSFPDRLARSLGLDELSLTGAGTLDQRALTLGKRISSSVYLSYEMGLGGASRIAKLQYDLTRRWSLRAQAGTQNAVDLFYTLQFD
ncbi:MAG: translocation/assembly module TamB domain-containing protein, partial [Burkholderiales bacterium]|nr:translocation/assembly module TamB domain-containing protein [Burkholderiales bacterium]